MLRSEASILGSPGGRAPPMEGSFGPNVHDRLTPVAEIHVKSTCLVHIMRSNKQTNEQLTTTRIGFHIAIFINSYGFSHGYNWIILIPRATLWYSCIPTRSHVELVNVHWKQEPIMDFHGFSPTGKLPSQWIVLVVGPHNPQPRERALNSRSHGLEPAASIHWIPWDSHSFKGRTLRTGLCGGSVAYW